MSTVICDDFRFNVNRILQQRGLSRSDLARRMGCSPAFVTQLLSAPYDPGLKVVDRVAAALEVAPSTLLKKNPQTA